MSHGVAWKIDSLDVDDIYYYTRYNLGLANISRDGATLVFEICAGPKWTLAQVE
jgi:hypothetical protein